MRRTRPFLPARCSPRRSPRPRRAASAGAQARPAAARRLETPAGPKPDPNAAETAAEKAQTREEDLKALRGRASRRTPRPARKLDAEIAAIRTDRAKLNAALIETAERVRGDRGADARPRGAARRR